MDDLSEDGKRILVDRLAMYRFLRDTTVAKFGEARFLEYDRVYSHFVGLFVAAKACRCAQELRVFQFDPQS